MKIAIMQPYFLPYLGYFSLIKNTDKFILFDTVQYIRHGWIERNRILKQDDGWLYVQVPVLKNGQSTLIKDVKINNALDWKGKILSQLQHYKKKAPNYYSVISLLNELFISEFDNIVTLNKESLKLICDYLNIDSDICVFSELNLDIEMPSAPDEWALNICKSMPEVTEYWNPPGGLSFFDRAKYENAGIDIRFQNVKLEEYNQNRTPFESGLSIIDVMMFNAPEQITEMLNNYEFI